MVYHRPGAPARVYGVRLPAVWRSAAVDITLVFEDGSASPYQIRANHTLPPALLLQHLASFSPPRDAVPPAPAAPCTPADYKSLRGFWRGGEWHPLTCAVPEAADVVARLPGEHTLVMLGDSNTRYLASRMCRLFQAQERQTNWSHPLSHASCAGLMQGTHLHLYFSFWKVGTPGSPIVGTLGRYANLTRGTRATLYLNMGSHHPYLSAPQYREKLRDAIRDARSAAGFGGYKRRIVSTTLPAAPRLIPDKFPNQNKSRNNHRIYTKNQLILSATWWGGTTLLDLFPLALPLSLAGLQNDAIHYYKTPELFDVFARMVLHSMV